jgi:hypothetical protein
MSEVIATGAETSEDGQHQPRGPPKSATRINHSRAVHSETRAALLPDKRPKSAIGSLMSGLVATGPNALFTNSRGGMQASPMLASGTRGGRMPHPEQRTALSLDVSSVDTTTTPGNTADSGYASHPQTRQKPGRAYDLGPDSDDKENEDRGGLSNAQRR